MKGTVPGFKTSALAAGIKANGALDLGLIYSDSPAVASAVFTQNRFAAAPVIISKRHLEESRYRMRALLVNSGNANAVTGSDGMRRAEACVAGKKAGMSAKGSSRCIDGCDRPSVGFRSHLRLDSGVS